MSVFFTAESYTDFDAYVEAIKTWELEFMQIGPGRVRADMRMFGVADIQIVKVQYNKLLLQNGSAPANGYTFAVHHHHSAPFLWRYLDFEYDSIIVFSDNNELQGVSQPGHHPVTVTISEVFIAAVAHGLGLPEPANFIPKGEVCACDPEAIYQIQDLLISICRVVKSTSGRGAPHLMTNTLKCQLTRDLLLALAFSKGIKPKKRQFQRRKMLVEEVMNTVNADLSTPKTISELCKITEVGERTLRNVFYEQFSVSPKKFINSYRLNKVKNALNRFESSDFNVSDIANAYGFWHMGQFARDYHRLFGELPSETQKK
jgi:AraC family ethanolamine operon transcriptional activator